MIDIKNAPRQPGIYLMKNRNNTIIYIGKAKNLKNRVKSYFTNPKAHTDKTRALTKNITDIDYIITNTEIEALILEAEMIRKHKPQYNIDLKDDKAFPYITITTSEKYPRLIISRRNLSKKDIHFGPYTTTVKSLVLHLRKAFGIRDCKSKALPKKVCLSYHIKRCPGPCESYITHEKYIENIKHVKQFLGGNTKKTIEDIKNRMKTASENHNYESAAIYRDQIKDLKILAEKQAIVSPGRIDTDIIGISRNNNKIAFNMLTVRSTMITASRNYIFNIAGRTEEILADFIKQYYSKHSEQIPKEILVPNQPEDQNIITEWLSSQKQQKATITVPIKGEKSKLLKISQKNAQDAYNQSEIQKRDQSLRLATLKDALNLKKTPYIIESFDISTIGGKHSVGSMVSFKDAAPDKSNYRRFKIKTVTQTDDFAMMEEVIARRYSRIKKENLEMPDLILIDGGKGQLSRALKVFKDLNIRDQPVIGLAKRDEEVYLPNRTDPITLKKGSKALLLLIQIRDETHRFAIIYHKLLRKKNFLTKD